MIFKNNIEADIEKERALSSSLSGFLFNKEYTGLNSFLKKQVILNWPLIGEGTKPSVLSFYASECILYKVVKEGRVKSAPFNDLRSGDIFLASTIFSILNKAAKHSIPADAIADRIEQFMVGESAAISKDLNWVIAEYRRRLTKAKVLDSSMVYEKYFCELRDNPNYIEVEDLSDILDDFKSISIRKLPSYTITENYTYFDMLASLSEVLKNLEERGIPFKDVCIIYPSYSKWFEKQVTKVSKHISFLNSSFKLSKDRDIGACIAALSLKNGYFTVLNSSQKINFLKTVCPSLNPIDLRYDLDSKIADFLNSDEIFKISYDAEFIKAFYKKYITPKEVSIRGVSDIANLVKDLLMYKVNANISLRIDEDEIKYIIEKMNSFLPSRLIHERIEKSQVLAVTPQEYIDYNINRKHKIIFDASNSSWDIKIENELSTDLAYLSDDFLSNIKKENIWAVYEDYGESRLDYRVNSILDFDSNHSLYILKSDMMVSGREQENQFYFSLLKNLNKTKRGV